jgi:hypothetical protein
MKALDLARRLVVCSLLVACSQELGAPAADGVARIDGRSAASFEASVDALRVGMSPQEISDLTDAFLRIGSRDSVEVLRANDGDLEAVNRALRETLHGLSAAEVLVEGADGTSRK